MAQLKGTVAKKLTTAGSKAPQFINRLPATFHLLPTPEVLPATFHLLPNPEVLL